MNFLDVAQHGVSINITQGCGLGENILLLTFNYKEKRLRRMISNLEISQIVDSYIIENRFCEEAIKALCAESEAQE